MPELVPAAGTRSSVRTKAGLRAREEPPVLAEAPFVSAPSPPSRYPCGAQRDPRIPPVVALNSSAPGVLGRAPPAS